MVTPYEQELLAMARTHASQNTRVADPILPELPADLFGVPNEVPAAQVYRTLPNSFHIEASAIEEAGPMPDLGAIMMQRAMQEIGQNNLAILSAEDSFQINFEAEEALAGAGAPNERVRFQVGRESPPADYFSRSQNSTDGEVVSQRSAAGRFQPVRPAVVRPVITPVREARSLVSRPVASSQAPRQAPIPREHIKSSYERLMGPSHLDD